MEHYLTIHKLIHGGKGLGTLADGMKVMVPGVLPGETVTIQETKVHRGHKEAELVRIDQPSPDRIVPPCPHFGRCGGCDLQHVAYAAQLECKQQILHESLLRAGMALTDDQCRPPLPSPLTLGYRHRIRLHLDATGNLGFHQASSNTVVPIRRCLLATEPINRVLAALVEADLATRLRGTIMAIELLHSPADDRVFLVAHPAAEATGADLAPLPALLASLADGTIVLPSRRGQERQPAHDITLCQHCSLLGLDYTLRWDADCFFQVNVVQNIRLVELAVQELKCAAPATVLDLYCGMGNFSLPLALRGALVTGIEQNRHSIRWAGRNAAVAGLATCRFLAGDVEAHLIRLHKQRATFDCILLDPPRQGLGKATALLPALRARRIVAISCDPATQARDLGRIIAKGYRLRSITPVDMFPQTHHIESVALLEKERN